MSLPAGRFAVAVHAGGFDEIDRSYGRLGSHVAENDDPLPEPIREHYLVGPDHAPRPARLPHRDLVAHQPHSVVSSRE